MKKKGAICISALVLAFSLFVTGCRFDKAAAGSYNKSKKPSVIPSQTAAENDTFELMWSEDEQCVLLKHKETQKIWSNIPYEYMLEGGSSANVNSTCNIRVMNTTNRQMNSVRGYIDANTDGRVFCKKIKNGIKVTYCFDKYQISVPINYVLRGDSLAVSVDVKNIKESREDYVLVSVSPAPFLCSAQNSPNNYLFVPTGSGALMYTDERPEGIRSYSGEVYGTDAARPQARILTDEEPIRLPAFGVKNGEYALLGIIESGADAAVVDAEAGNSKTGYSNVYPTFYVRGYDIFEEQREDLVLTSEELSQNPLTVAYYFLSGELADYNGMAKTYRSYLQNKNLLESSPLEQKLFSVTLLGGILNTTSTLGIPHKQLNAMTTFSQAESIIKEISSFSEEMPAVRMRGFGSSGVNYGGEVAGGYKFPSEFGSSSKRKEIEKLCRENGISLFTEFDLLRLSKSGSGFFTFSDSAKTAVLKSSLRYPVNSSLRQFDKSMGYHFLKKELVQKAADKLVSFCGKAEISGISLFSLGDIAYSDYSENQYYVKGKTEKEMSDIISGIKQDGYPLASGANAYAAAASDVVFGAPLDNGGYDCFDASIPFYQMVFRGIKPIYGSGANMAESYDKQLMLSAVGGCGIDFAIVGNYSVEYSETNTEKIYAALYEDNKPLIEALTAGETDRFAQLYRAAGNSPIESYEIIDKALSKTVFENGTVVYANHSGRSVETALGRFEAYEFKVN